MPPGTGRATGRDHIDVASHPHATRAPVHARAVQVEATGAQGHLMNRTRRGLRGK